MSESHAPHDASAAATAADSGADESADVSGTAEVSGSDEPEFTNRAARRAKGAASGKAQTFTKGKAPVGRGAVQSPRQYGARRSG